MPTAHISIAVAAAANNAAFCTSAPTFLGRATGGQVRDRYGTTISLERKQHVYCNTASLYNMCCVILLCLVAASSHLHRILVLVVAVVVGCSVVLMSVYEVDEDVAKEEKEWVTVHGLVVAE